MIAAKLGDKAQAHTLLTKAMDLTPNFNPLDVRLAQATLGAHGSQSPLARTAAPVAKTAAN